MPSWRRVLTVGCSFAELCVARDMNMFLARGVTIVLFLYLLKCMGLNFEWPDVLLTLVDGLGGYGLVRALLSQIRPSVGKDRAQVHVHMEGACTLTALINALLSTPLCHFLKFDVKPARESLSWPKRSPCVATGVQMRIVPL